MGIAERSAWARRRLTAGVLRYLRPGDWLILSCGVIAVAWMFAALWFQGGADRAVIRAGGKVFAEVSLYKDRTIRVPGPLGTSLIAIRAGRARVAQDPGPRQLCVKQGWLSSTGQIAICLPNEVSLELVGKIKLYDSLNY